MAKIDVISGFLGAGKTTLIKKLLKEAFQNEQVVFIENEFGEIGIDGGFLKEAGVQITEMNSGCICCSLVGDFGEALKKVVSEYHPDRVIIEPSGVGKLSDVMGAILKVSGECDLTLNSATTVADASKCKIYMKNFGEFYDNQIENAGAIVLSRTQNVSEEKLNAAVALLREKNEQARILTTPWDDLSGARILEVMEDSQDLTRALLEEAQKEKEEHEHHHHHHHDDDDDECCCGHDHEHEHHHHHHDDDDDECCCGHDHEHEYHHHHHDDDDECCCGHDHEHEHHHHHDDDDDECCCGHDHEHEHHHHHHDEDEEECSCGCGGHHHHHHHADEVFTSWGKESPKKFDKAALDEILEKLSESGSYGMILRSKGIVPLTDGTWAHFDLVPGEYEIRLGEADFTGRLCVIGSQLKEEALEELFGL